MRYFGLLAPRTKKLTSSTVWAGASAKSAGPLPLHEPWNGGSSGHFGVDPLIDAFGNQMCWVGRIAPVPACR